VWGFITSAVPLSPCPPPGQATPDTVHPEDYDGEKRETRQRYDGELG
jgi:hypothetical protein